MTEEEARTRLATFRRVNEERDAMVRAAREAGVNVRQISLASGLTRKTVYRILGLTPDES